MTRSTRKKPRKPKEFDVYNCHADIYESSDGPQVHIDHDYFDDPKDCRRLASWLLKAAEYLEASEK